MVVSLVAQDGIKLSPNMYSMFFASKLVLKSLSRRHFYQLEPIRVVFGQIGSMTVAIWRGRMHGSLLPALLTWKRDDLNLVESETLFS